MRRWTSKVGGIAFDRALQQELDASQRSAEYNVPLAPKCHRCSLMTGKRVHVDKYAVVDHGCVQDTPWVVFKAWHHGEESAIKLVGWSWPPRHGERFKFVMAGLPFFTGQSEVMLHVPTDWNKL